MYIFSNKRRQLIICVDKINRELDSNVWIRLKENSTIQKKLIIDKDERNSV